MFLESKAYVYKAQPPAYINYDPTIMHGSDARTTGAALQLLFLTLIDLRQFFVPPSNLINLFLRRTNHDHGGWCPS